MERSPSAAHLGFMGMQAVARSVWARPEPLATELGKQGERLTANARLGAVTVLALLPLTSVVHRPGDAEPWIDLAAALGLIAIGLVVKSWARRPVPPAWLGLFSCLLDVTTVTAGNVAFVLASQPLAATSGRVYFGAYLLALSLTCLRQDQRLCLVAGVAAILQYFAIALWVSHDVSAHAPGLSSYGAFQWDNQLARLVFLVVGTAVNVTIVRQSRSFLDASLHDLLTALPNRRYAEIRLREAIAQSLRSGRPLVVALADLDRFKRVNDVHGHAAGDLVLREVARRLRAFCRVSDLVARYGGEEFLILLPDTDVEGALERLGRLHAEVGAAPVELPEGTEVPVTLSIGAASCPADGTGAGALLARADERLYLAKEGGRNRLVA